MSKSIRILFQVLLTALALGTHSAYAQAPQAIPYQAVARDNTGATLSNQAISLQLSIHDATATGTIVYQETHGATTNSLGLFTLNIGQGTPTIGTLSTINWALGSKFIQVELDPAGGTSYTDMGTTQLMSVPYALSSGDNQWVKNGNDISNNNSGNVGIGTNTPTTQYGGQKGLEIKGNVPQITFNDDGGTYTNDFRIENGGQFAVMNNATTNTDFMVFDLVNPGEKIGMGTYTPAAKLDIVGNLKITDGTQGNGKVLTSDVNGLASWQSTASLIGPQGPAGLLPNGSTAGNTPYWNGSSWIVNSSNIFNNGGNVGIGTSNPNARLDVNGDALINGITVGRGNNSNVNNTAIGLDALKVVTNAGSFNTAVGTSALRADSSGDFNTAVGTSSQFSTTTGIANSSLGYNSLSLNTSGEYNAAIGGWSLRFNNGSYNTALGYGALYGNTDGTFNSAVGYGAGFIAVPGLTNATAIGANAMATQSNSLVLGSIAGTNTATSGVNVGIGTTAPSAKLDVIGNVKITDGTQGNGKVLKSDANGLASWGTLSGNDLLSTPVVPDLSCPIAVGSVATGSGSTPYSVAVVGNYAYVVNTGTNNMQVINITNPATPAIVGTVTTGSSPHSVAIAGNYAYVANFGSNTMQVINITNPALPAVVGSVATGANPRTVVVAGNYAYVVNASSNNMQVINITNPALPSVVGSVATQTNPTSVVVSGNYAYVTNYASNSVQAINITNPALPAVVGSVATSSPYSIKVSGNYAYVVNPISNSLRVINISNPASPTVVGFIATTGSPISVDVSGNYAHIVNYTPDVIQTINISNPSSPTLISTTSLATSPTSVVVSGNYAYTVSSAGQVMGVLKLVCDDNFAVTVNPSTGLTTALPFQWNTSGNNISNDNSGNVGIGTTAPAFKLTTSFSGSATNAIPTTGTTDANAGFRLTTGSVGLDFGTVSLGPSYLQNRNIGNFATAYQLLLNPVGGGVSIGGYNNAFAQAPFTCTIYGTAYCNSGFFSGSDIRYKKNIQPIRNALQGVMNMKGVSYDFKTEEFSDLHFDKEKQIGVIAQDVEKVFPELVRTDSQGFKSVCYDQLGPILIEAVKEQQVQIEAQQKQIDELKALIKK